jgi:ribulose-5-phosphate 4-epimerase/fuculose-1-phosphate aldolase
VWSTRCPKATGLPRRSDDRKAVILQNHGILTVGSTVDEAAWFFISMERSCQSQMLAESIGKPIPISHESAIVAQKQVGNARVGWFQYQPLWDLIIEGAA